MPRSCPVELRRDVVAVARRHESLVQIAKGFGVSEATFPNWIRQADVGNGFVPGATVAEAAELRALKKRMGLLEEQNKVLLRAAAYLSQANLPKV